MCRTNYTYQVQLNNESEIKIFDKVSEIVNYLNDEYKMPLITIDILHGFFRCRTKRKNVLLTNLSILDRVKIPNKHQPKKEKVKS